MAIKTARYAGDFETITDPSDVRVWGACLVDIDTSETAFIGNSIESFFDFLRDRNTVVYFHNLKFDGEYILSYLLRNGYTYSDSHESGTFETLITDDGVFYSITVYFEKKKKKYKKAVFYDSLKKLPFKVSVISKAFELKDQKLKIDYDAPRPVGHELTAEERAYIVNDCRIVAQALKIQFDKGLTKMTNASDALNGYKGIIGKGFFEKWFPTLPVELDDDIRQAYRGGFTYLTPRFKNKHVKGGITLDVNSLYPSVMYDRVLPYGYPMYFEGEYEPDERYPIYIQHLKCCFKLKPGHIPTIQKKGSGRFVETEYLTSSVDSMGIDEPVELYLTTPDMVLFLEHYDIFDEEYINGYKFKGTSGMFKEYIDFWMHIKETTSGAMRQLAKLMLNSLYGKFATNPHARKKIPVMDDFGVVRYELDAPELRDPVYTAMGAFITAYAREKTIRSAQQVYDRFIYADTDSLHLVGVDIPEGLEVHPTKLGAWKHEGTFIDSKYIRAKTYIETMIETKKTTTLETYARIMNRTFDVWRETAGIKYHDMKVTCAGMPDNVKEHVTYENFASGATFDGKLMPRRYPGGIVLRETTFTIK